MPLSPETVAHQAAALVDVPASFALAHLSDAGMVGRWALGSMDLQPSGKDSVFRGRSLFDGSIAHVEIRAHPELGLIDYHVGTEASRSPRIMIRVAPASVAGLGDVQCLVTLFAWRNLSGDADRWARTCTTHEAEILLIKAQLETAHAAGVRP